MRKFILFILFITPAVLFAQKKTGSIKGIIYDSINDYALQSASITIYRLPDSSVADFQLSNNNGEFEIKNLPLKTGFYYIISHTGYRTLQRDFSLDSSTLMIDFKKINLEQKAENEMEEVVVQSVQPLRMNGDTLEINPDAFKLDSNAVVEDMLMRVPGLTIWGDGSITMNGKKIEKVYVDGKPFFGGAAETATQNLPKNAIQRVQLYQEKDYSKLQNTDEKTDSLYAMNIKLKEDKKKGVFGKLGAGYGTDERYQADGVLQFYNKRTQGGIAAGINNINKEEGTGENAFLENTFKSNFRVFYGGRNNAGGGITRRTYANAKVQHNFSESENSQFYNRITGDYGYLNTNTNLESSSTNVQNINDSIQAYKLTNINNNKSISVGTKNNIKFLYENRKQYGNFLNMNVDYTHQDNRSDGSSTTNVLKNDTTAVSNSYNNNQSFNRNDNLNLFGFVRSNDAGQLEDPRKNFMVFFSGGYNRSNGNSSTVSRFESFIDTIPSNIIDRRYNTSGENYYANFNFNYDGFKQLIFGIYNFYNIDVSLSNNINISRNRQNALVTDLDTITQQYVQNTLLTNQNTLTNFTYQPGLRLSKSFNKWVSDRYNYWLSISMDLLYQFLNQKNESSILFRNIERDFRSFTPNLSINFNYEKSDAFRIYSYVWGNTNLNPPGIDQLYPIVDSTNRYNIVAGNPNLKASTTRNITWNGQISRTKQKTKSNYSLGFNMSLNSTSNAISDSTVYDSTGRSIRYLINVAHQNNFNGGLNMQFSTELSKTSSINFSYNPYFSHNNRPGFMNGYASTSVNKTFSNAFKVLYSLMDKFNISIGETISVNKSSQNSISRISSVIKNYTTSANLNYFITKSFSFNTSIDYQNNIAANGNAIKAGIWNANTTYRFMQQKAEIRLSAFDLLRQNKNINNFVDQNSATTTISNGLQQYFMITLSYYPRKFGNNNRRGGGPGVMIVR